MYPTNIFIRPVCNAILRVGAADATYVINRFERYRDQLPWSLREVTPEELNGVCDEPPDPEEDSYVMSCLGWTRDQLAAWADWWHTWKWGDHVDLHMLGVSARRRECMTQFVTGARTTATQTVEHIRTTIVDSCVAHVTKFVIQRWFMFLVALLVANGAVWWFAINHLWLLLTIAAFFTGILPLLTAWFVWSVGGSVAQARSGAAWAVRTVFALHAIALIASLVYAWRIIRHIVQRVSMWFEQNVTFLVMFWWMHH